MSYCRLIGLEAPIEHNRGTRPKRYPPSLGILNTTQQSPRCFKWYCLSDQCRADVLVDCAHSHTAIAVIDIPVGEIGRTSSSLYSRNRLIKKGDWIFADLMSGSSLETEGMPTPALTCAAQFCRVVRVGIVGNLGCSDGTGLECQVAPLQRTHQIGRPPGWYPETEHQSRCLSFGYAPGNLAPTADAGSRSRNAVHARI